MIAERTYTSALTRPLAAVLLVVWSLAAVPCAAQGPREQVQVRGHWVIDVRNVDGTLASHREFDNHLQPGVIVPFLGHSRTVGRWLIRLYSAGTGTAVIAMVEQDDSYFGGGGIISAEPLGVTTTGNALVLTGTAKATAAVSISNVGTEVGFCAATVAPADCHLATQQRIGSDFSTTAVSPVIGVAATQLIQVTVTFTFTSTST